MFFSKHREHILMTLSPLAKKTIYNDLLSGPEASVHLETEKVE